MTDFLSGPFPLFFASSLEEDADEHTLSPSD
jgi:hypothetical protein